MEDIEKNTWFEMPADVAEAIKDLQPNVKSKIEEVFQAYNDSEVISSTLSDLNEYFNKFENVSHKYWIYEDLVKKLRSICEKNDIDIEESYSHNIKIWNLINIKVSLEEDPPYWDLLDNFAITYIWTNHEHKEKFVQICELLKNEL